MALVDVDDGGTTVWAWTGDNEDVVDDDTELYRVDIAKSDSPAPAEKASLTTEFAGSQQKLGSSVLYTLQLLDDGGDPATVGTDGENPARYLATLTTNAYNPATSDFSADVLLRNLVPMTTDSDGKASITVAAPPNDPLPSSKTDKYRVTLTVMPLTVVNPDDPPNNAPTAALVNAMGADITGNSVQVIFSTEPGVRTAADINISVKPAADYIAADDRGASTRATVSVSDQYGDPITGVRVSLTSTGSDDDGNDPTIGGGRSFAVGSDGSYTFGYERSGTRGSLSATETLEPNMEAWDHDGDACSTADTTASDHRCARWRR